MHATLVEDRVNASYEKQRIMDESSRRFRDWLLKQCDHEDKMIFKKRYHVSCFYECSVCGYTQETDKTYE